MIWNRKSKSPKRGVFDSKIEIENLKHRGEFLYWRWLTPEVYWRLESGIKNYKATEPYSILPGTKRLFTYWIDFTYLFELHFPISLRIDDTIRVKMTVMELSRKWTLHLTKLVNHVINLNLIHSKINKTIEKYFFSSKSLRLKNTFLHIY